MIALASSPVAASGPMFAQLSTSVTDDRIRMIIAALLIVAALLGLATIWFFVHTSPRRRVKKAAAARGPADAQRPSAVPEQQIDLVSPPAAAVAAPSPVTTPIAGSAAAPAAVEDDDDWLRLTGPETRADGARRTHG